MAGITITETKARVFPVELEYVRKAFEQRFEEDSQGMSWRISDDGVDMDGSEEGIRATGSIIFDPISPRLTRITATMSLMLSQAALRQEFGSRKEAVAEISKGVGELLDGLFQLARDIKAAETKGIDGRSGGGIGL